MDVKRKRNIVKFGRNEELRNVNGEKAVGKREPGG